MKEIPMTFATATATVELDYRHTDGVHVTLVWEPETNRVLVEVFDEKNDETFSFEAPAERALDAFWHPYAYAAFAGLSFTVRTREPVGV